jgi:hypothetical protein
MTTTTSGRAATSDQPCPRCRNLYDTNVLDDPEMVQPLGEHPALARDGTGPCCDDCRAADTLLSLDHVGPDFGMARIAVGNDRQEQYRLPAAPLGLVHAGLMKPSQPGDLHAHLAWLARHGIVEAKEAPSSWTRR